MSLLYTFIFFSFQLLFIHSYSILQFQNEISPLNSPKEHVNLPEYWQTLGPFPCGSREIGIDVLSPYGGFENLTYSETDLYPSELADGGYVKWKTIHANNDASVGPILYPNVRWEFNQKSFGWASMQHSIFFRGIFSISTPGFYVASVSNVHSFKIDNMASVGNSYNDSFAAPSIVYLSAGNHTFFISTVYDIRIYGDSIPPKITFLPILQHIDDYAPQERILLFPNEDVMPEIMNNSFITPFVSISVQNGRNGHVPTSIKNILPQKNHRSLFQKKYIPGWIQLEEIIATSEKGIELKTINPNTFSIKLSPGQVFGIPIKLIIPDNLEAPETLTFQLKFLDLYANSSFLIKTQSYSIKKRKWNDVYKITFMDYDHTVQYAMIRPPTNNSCVRDSLHLCPVLIALHGAGVDIGTSDWWFNAFKPQSFAWTLFPTGRRPWGHDWHGASHLNVQTALLSMTLPPGIPPELLENIKPDVNNLIFAGHSNGGQGAWWMASHFPDQVLAVIPASGYMKIEFYIPYYMRIGDSYSDPHLRAILDLSITEHNIDLYTSNLAGIPILARTGGNDENVPPLHTRRIVRLVNEWNGNIKFIKLIEDSEKGHWYDGILSDTQVQDFLDQSLNLENNPNYTKPALPDSFTLSTLNPFSTGSRGGIRILQLIVPFRLATIRVYRNGNQWLMNSTNVRRIGFVHESRHEDIESWNIDGTLFNSTPSSAGPSYLKKPNGVWEAAPDLLWISKERHPSTYGPIIHVFNHPFFIVIPSHSNANISVYYQIANQIASSWYSCCKGNSQIIKDVDVLDGVAAKYNLIVLGGPIDNLYTRRREREGVSTMIRFTDIGGYTINNKVYNQPGTGSLFLAPSPARTRTALFVSGIDIKGLLRAAWSIPFRTGVTIPDYIIVGEEFGDSSTGWVAGNGSPYGGTGTKGAGGILAAGFWNNAWDFDEKCGYLK